MARTQMSLDEKYEWLMKKPARRARAGKIRAHSLNTRVSRINALGFLSLGCTGAALACGTKDVYAWVASLMCLAVAVGFALAWELEPTLLKVDLRDIDAQRAAKAAAARPGESADGEASVQPE
jgi:hypothetical protein